MSEGKLPFLDVLLQQEPDGSISTTVFRKSTHTDRYLNFMSHHSLADKPALVRLCTGGPEQSTLTQRLRTRKPERSESPSSMIGFLEGCYSTIRLEADRRAVSRSSGHPPLCAWSIRGSTVSPHSTRAEGLPLFEYHSQTATSETKRPCSHRRDVRSGVPNPMCWLPGHLCRPDKPVPREAHEEAPYSHGVWRLRKFTITT